MKKIRMVKGQGRRKKSNFSKRASAQRRRREAEKRNELLDADITDTPM